MERKKACSYVFFQAEDGIRDVERSRGLGDVYKRQPLRCLKLFSRFKLSSWLQDQKYLVTMGGGLICLSKLVGVSTIFIWADIDKAVITCFQHWHYVIYLLVSWTIIHIRRFLSCEECLTEYSHRNRLRLSWDFAATSQLHFSAVS